MKPKKTWILIADAGTARIVENNGPGKGLHQLGGKTCYAAGPNTPYDVPGDSVESAFATHQKLDDAEGSKNTSEKFASAIVDTLSKCHRKDCFDRLIICAAPRMLSYLRQQLPGPVKSDVIAEIPKDLTRIPTEALSDHFNHVLHV